MFALRIILFLIVLGVNMGFLIHWRSACRPGMTALSTIGVLVMIVAITSALVTHRRTHRP